MTNNEKNEPTLKLTNDVLFKSVYGSDTKESKFILKSLRRALAGIVAEG